MSTSFYRVYHTRKSSLEYQIYALGKVADMLPRFITQVSDIGLGGLWPEVCVIDSTVDVLIHTLFFHPRRTRLVRRPKSRGATRTLGQAFS